MNGRLASLFATIVVAWATLQTPYAQSTSARAPGEPKRNPLLKLIDPWPDEAARKARRAEAEARPLFQSAAPLEFTMSADFGAINRDHNPESAQRYPGVLTVAGPNGAPSAIPVALSARGHFRRMARNCSWVPLRIEFPRERVAGTVFDGQTTLKLGTGCEATAAFEQYTLREYLSYPMFNLVTPLSFRARLARATYVDASSHKPITTRYALFIEHENDVARRNEGRTVELPRVEFTAIDADSLTRMMLYEYMIGNTDFSIWALHNVRFIQTPPRTLLVVPYDFDLSGFVHAPYAAPDRRLGLRSVLDRKYRGPCRTTEEFDAAAAPFRDKRVEMLALLDSMRDIDATARRDAKEYLETFFRAIERPASIKRQFVDGCKPTATM